jgi:hypothetical protein
MVEAFLNMLSVGHFGGDRQSGRFLNFFQPWKSDSAYAFECSGTGSGFPDSGPKKVYAPGFLQIPSGLQHLSFCFCGAGACEEDGFGFIRKDWVEFHGFGQRFYRSGSLVYNTILLTKV